LSLSKPGAAAPPVEPVETVDAQSAGFDKLNQR
jgi:hypothetical protein